MFAWQALRSIGLRHRRFWQRRGARMILAASRCVSSMIGDSILARHLVEQVRKAVEARLFLVSRLHLMDGVARDSRKLLPGDYPHQRPPQTLPAGDWRRSDAS